jgi:hypothetical protein
VIAGRWQLVRIGAVLALGGGVAQAENIDAGKSGPALFAATCQACHSSPRGLVKDGGTGLTSFLREHYTASAESANLLATYLMANQGGRGAGKQDSGARRRAGQTAEPKTKSETAAHPPQTVTARPDSMIEPVEQRRHQEPGKGAGRGKRPQTKQETTAAPPPAAAEPAVAAPPPAAPPPAAAAAPPASAPVAAAPPDQPAFSAPSP